MKGKQKIYEKGITLIALVITIIVLLILAWVTLSIVFNEGIISKSQMAVDEYKVSEYKEDIEVIKTGEYFKKITDKLQQSLKELVVDKLKSEENEKWVKTVETSEEDSKLEINQIKVVTKDNYIIIAEIEDNGRVTYITIERDNGEPYPTLILEQLALEVTENEKAKLKVIANVDKIKKTKKIEKIELILDGKVVETRSYSESKVQDIFEIEKEGNYTVKVTTDQGKSTSKKINILINTLTIKHYLENANDTNYTLFNTTRSIVKYGTIINIEEYKTEIENGTYNYGSLIESITGGEAIQTTTMEPNKTICLYYSRDTYTLTLSKGNYISTVSGGGIYKVGQSTTINATVSSSATGYTNSWYRWTSNNTSLIPNNTTKNAKITMPAGNITLTATGTRSANSYIVTCIDKVGSTSGTTLGSSTYYRSYGSTVYGSDKGSSTTVGAYYSGYYYSSCTSATVTTSGATVYRIFIKQPETYTINYYANGGKGSMSSGTKTEGLSYTISNCGFIAPSGYTFAGWATSSTSHTVSYSAGSSYTTNANLDLYAIWYCSGTGTYSKQCTKATVCGETLLEKHSGLAEAGPNGYLNYVYWTCVRCGTNRGDWNSIRDGQPADKYMPTGPCTAIYCDEHKTTGKHSITGLCSHYEGSEHYYN